MHRLINDVTFSFLVDECRSKKSELGEKTKEITALKKRLSMTEVRLVQIHTK